MAKTLREIPIDRIEKRFRLAGYIWGGTYCPAVARRDEGGYLIRIEVPSRPGDITYDYFYLEDDGTVTAAPRGYARDYRPGRITGLAEAVERYAAANR